jgi:hypothetical protein
MSWKVYGFMEPNGRDAYGPLPRKRWIRDIPHKRHKLAYRFHYSQRGAETADQYNERHAIAYARWLAERDGVDIPKTAEARVVWSGIYSGTKKRTHRRWDGGTSQHAAYCKRIEAVEFGRKYREEHYNTRADGKRGAWLYTTNKMEIAARIEIPNWDWEPAEPVEEVDAAEMLAA